MEWLSLAFMFVHEVVPGIAIKYSPFSLAFAMTIYKRTYARTIAARDYYRKTMVGSLEERFITRQEPRGSDSDD